VIEITSSIPLPTTSVAPAIASAIINSFQ
jgi:hypothetical protein